MRYYNRMQLTWVGTGTGDCVEADLAWATDAEVVADVVGVSGGPCPVPYLMENPGTGEYEYGRGLLRIDSAFGYFDFARDVVFNSSNGGAKVAFTAGMKLLTVTPLAQSLVTSVNLPAPPDTDRYGLASEPLTMLNYAGDNCIAGGSGAFAFQNSISLGTSTYALVDATAAGARAQARSSFSTALGADALVLDDYSTAIGPACAYVPNTVAIGAVPLGSPGVVRDTIQSTTSYLMGDTSGATSTVIDIPAAAYGQSIYDIDILGVHTSNNTVAYNIKGAAWGGGGLGSPTITTIYEAAALTAASVAISIDATGIHITVTGVAGVDMRWGVVAKMSQMLYAVL